MPATVHYFAGLTEGLGAFSTTSVYLAQTVRFPDDDLTSSGSSNVVTAALSAAMPRETILVSLVSDGPAAVRPRDAVAQPTAWSAAECAKGFRLTEASPHAEFQLPKGWTFDMVALA